MPTPIIMPAPRMRFFDNIGLPLVRGYVFTFAAGTSTKLATYQDAAGLIPHENPIRLDDRGEATIYWLGNYKVDLRTAGPFSSQVPGYPVDNFNAVDSNGATSLAIDSLKATYAAGGGAALQGFMPAGLAAVATTTEKKLREFPSFADKGVNSVNDGTVGIQAAMDMKYAMAGDEGYLISAPLKLSSLSHISGRRAGTAFTGATSNPKWSIKKTTRTSAAVTNFQTGVVSNVDCIIYTDPVWIDNGVDYPQKGALEYLSLAGDPALPNAMGVYIEQGSGWTMRDMQISGCVNAIYAKECWSTVVENIQTNGKIVWLGGTSITFTNIGTGSSPTTTGGFSFASLIYSTMNSCWADGVTNTGFRFVNSKLTLNGCGVEGSTTGTANSGTAIAFDGGDEVTLNGFVCVPMVNQVLPIYTVGFDSAVTFNQGCSGFGVAGVNCPDLYVWGNGSTVIFNDYKFVNGTRDNPVIQFANGVTTTTVIVNFGSNRKVYTSNGAGSTIIEALRDSGSYTPVLTIGGVALPISAGTFTGTWQKNGKLVTVNGRIALTTKGASTGIVQLSGWPVGFVPLGDTQVNFALVASITGGPISGVIDIGSPTANLITLTATGDPNLTDANLTNTSLLRYSFTYTIA